MSGSQGYTAPNFVIPYKMPETVPEEIKPAIRPIYTAFQNIIHVLINFAGIASRSPQDILSSANDPTAILANNVHRYYIQTLVNISYGTLINLFAAAGTLFIQPANATTGSKPCDGFCNSPGINLAGSIVEVVLNDGVITGLSGFVVGSRYYLSIIGGQLTTVAPVAAGNLQQQVGIAVTTGAFRFFTGPQIQH